MNKLWGLWVILFCVLLTQPTPTARTQTTLKEIQRQPPEIPIPSPESPEVREKKDSLINLLNKIAEQAKKTQPKIVYRTKYKTEYIQLPPDTVYIVIADTSLIPENDYYIIETEKNKAKKRNWLKKLFKKHD